MAGEARRREQGPATFADPAVARRNVLVFGLAVFLFCASLPDFFGSQWRVFSLDLVQFLFVGIEHRLARARGREVAAPRQVVVIGIDEPSLEKYGRWPWNRTVLADLVLALAAAGARTTVLDMLFSERDVTPLEELVRALEALPDPLRARPEVVAFRARIPDPGIAPGTVPEILRIAPEAARVQQALRRLDQDRTFAAALAKARNVILGTILEFEGSSRRGADWTSTDKAGAEIPENLRDLLLARLPGATPESVQQSWTQNMVVPLLLDDAAALNLVRMEKDGPGVGPITGPADRERLVLESFTYLGEDRGDERDRVVGMQLPRAELMLAAAGVGYMNDATAADGVARAMRLVAPLDDFLVPGLAVAAVAHYLQAEPVLAVDVDHRPIELRFQGRSSEQGPPRTRFACDNSVRLWMRCYGQRSVVTGAKAELEQGLARYREAVDRQVGRIEGHRLVGRTVELPAIETIPAAEVLRAGELLARGEAVAPSAEEAGFLARLRRRLEGRVALVGITATGGGDTRTNALHQNVPGVELHATAVANLLRREGMLQVGVGHPLVYGVQFACLLVLGWVMPRYNPLRSVLILGLLAGMSVAISLWAMAQGLGVCPYDHLVPMALYFGPAMAYLNRFENREKAWIDAMFKRYVSADYVEQLKFNKGRLELTGKESVITPFFSDMAKFSTISEAFSAEGLFRFLGEYLGEMAAMLDRHGGTLDKFEGDAVVAFFGAPIWRADHAVRACLCSLEMQARIRVLEREWREGGRYPELHRLASKLGKWLPIVVRVGLNSGSCATGHLGTAERGNYTMMGDNVNLASRLESAGKQYGITLTLSEGTYELAKEAIVAREVDLIQVVGRTVPTRIYELLARRDAVEPELAAFLARWAEALGRYKEREFAKAKAIFESLRPVRPEDQVLGLYLERCERFLATPPAPDWDGVAVLTEK